MGFLHRVADDIRALKDLLKRYDFGQDGRSIYKELLQNADDAKASIIQLHLLEQGFGEDEVSNPLLRVPALVTVNNGRFRPIDAKNMRYATGTSKSLEIGAVGRFGLGQKSVFHLCEAWFCVGSSASDGVIACNMDPWEHPEDGDADFPLWPAFDKQDQLAIRRCLAPFLEGDDWFILWLPLRKREHRRKRSGVISDWYPDIRRLGEDLSQLDSLGRLLPQMGHLRQLQVHHHRNPGEVFARFDAGTSEHATTLSRPDEETVLTRPFAGEVKVGDTLRYSYFGAEQVALRPELASLKQNEHWPKTLIEEDGEPIEVSEQIVPHGGVTVVVDSAESSPAALHLDWCVFLPLGDQSSKINLPPNCRRNIWFRLHGYFFPDHGRRHVTGFAEAEDSSEIRHSKQFEAAWNRRLRDSVVLPCLLAPLDRALGPLPVSEQEGILGAFRDSSVFTGNRAAICRDQILVRGANGAFRLAPVATCLLPVPASVLDDARQCRLLLARAEEDGAALLVLDTSPRLTHTETPLGWDAERLSVALASPFEEHFNDRAVLAVLADMVEKLATSELRDATASSIFRRALRHHGPKVFTLKRLLESWQRLAACITRTPVLPTGEPSALAHIADLELTVLILPSTIAPGLHVQVSQADGVAILRALSAVIAASAGAPADAAGRLAAEVVSSMGASVVLADEELRGLPVFRAWSASTSAEVSLSPARVIELREIGLAFTGGLRDGFARQKCLALLHAIVGDGLDVVLVDELIGGPLRLPEPIEVELARPLVSSHRLDLQQASKERADLLDRLVSKNSKRLLDQVPVTVEGSLIRQAIRFLLHGASDKRRTDGTIWKSGETQGLAHDAVRAVFDAGAESWRLISEDLTKDLSDQWMRLLGIRTLGQHELLNELEKLDDDTLAALSIDVSDAAIDCLLRVAAPRSEIWKKLPLHHTVDDRRVSITNGRTWLQNSHWEVPRSLTGIVDLIEVHSETTIRAAQITQVPMWEPAAQVDCILAQEKPTTWAKECMDALAELAPSKWPRNLSAVPWLPVRVGDGKEQPNGVGVAPKDLLGLSPEVAVRVAGFLGGHTEAFIAPSEIATQLQDHPAFPTVVEELSLRGDALVQAVAMELEELKPTALALGARASGLVEYEQAVKSRGLAKHAGWALVQALHEAAEAPATVRDELVPALSYPMSCEDQIAVLNAIVESLEAAGDGQQEGELQIYEACLSVAAARPDFVEEVLTRMRVRNQAGQWVEPFHIARSGDNWKPAYRLDERIHHILEPVLDRARPGSAETPSIELVGERAPSQKDLADAASVLEHFFDPLFRRGIRQEAVGLLVALMGLGHDNAIRQLADDWLSVTPADSIWDWVIHRATSKTHLAMDNDHIALLDARYAVRVVQEKGGLVRTSSLLGTPLDAALQSGKATDTLFAGLGREQVGSGKAYWLRLLKVDPSLPREEVYELLRRSIEAFVHRRLRRVIRPAAFEARWRELSESGQVQLSAVRHQILENLATRLEGLSYKKHPALAKAVSKLMRAKQRAAEAEATFREAGWEEKIRGPRWEAEKAQRELIALVETDEGVHAFLLAQIRQKLHDYQYGPDRVLWELLQNADDASVQLREMLSSDPNAAEFVGRFRIETFEGRIRVTHWGRQINQHTLAGFRDGRSRGWDLDLLNMMVLNTSDKAPEHGTTGRFGLGFKSVYLISDQPRIGSGQLTFEVVAGMLPTALEKSPIRDAEWSRQEPPTVFELDLEERVTLPAVVGDWERFGGLAPLFCRAISEIDIVTDLGRTTMRWDPRELPAIEGVYLGVTSLGTGATAQPVKLVQLASGDGIDVVLQITDGRFRALPDSIPSLWCTAPTKEHWNLGVVINGPVAVDPGRSRVAIDRDETERVAERAGRTITARLGALYDALSKHWSAIAGELGLPPQPSDEAIRDFWRSAWEVMAKAWRSVQGADAARIELVRKLHGGAAGLTGLARRHSTLPTGLPGAFDVLTRLDQVKYIAEPELAEPEVLKTITSWAWMDSSFAPGAVVSRRVFDVMKGLNPDISRAQGLGLVEVLERWASPGGVGVDRERAVELHDVVDWLTLPSMRTDVQEATRKWMASLTFPSRGRYGAPPAKLLLPRLSEEVEVELRRLGEADRLRKLEDEYLRAGFAPSDHVLSTEVASDARAVRFFLTARRLQIGDRGELEQWARKAQMPKHQEAALRYCIRGEFGHALCERFREEPLRWFRDRNALGSQLIAGWPMADKVDLQNRLFPFNRLDPIEHLDPVVVAPTRVIRTFFDRFTEWWDQPAVRAEVTAAYEHRAWPGWLRPNLAEGIREDSAEHWLALLVLGACRSLGWADAGHHRRFVEEAQSRGWWDVFSRPKDDDAWMDMLRVWQDEAVTKLEYARWVGLFPSIYQLSRYLPKYRRLLRTAARRPAEMYQVRVLLAPRADERLTGAGTQFDAPPAPLNMGLHWVLRELVRLGDLEPVDHLVQDCWVPSAKVIEFLRPLGLDIPAGFSSNPDKAQAICEFLAGELGTEHPHLHKAFDVPLRHVAKDASVRKQLGLED
jgi:hypothetical protein